MVKRLTEQNNEIGRLLALEKEKKERLKKKRVVAKKKFDAECAIQDCKEKDVISAK